MNIRQTAIPRRVLSLALCAAMVLTLLPLPTQAEGICGHHPEHTADCGYKAAVEGQDCAHSHDSLCGYQEASPCSHSHDSLCGYREASACAHRHTEECGENGESCTHQHDEACGYQEASPCTHSHDESCGYREASPCKHEHDGSCGYVEAVEGSPCTYRCEICAQQASQQQNGQERCTHGNESAACETCASEKKVTEVQALINALPETVTEETREAAQSALSAVEEAKAALTEAEQEKLDLTRYTALKALLAEPEAVDTGKVLTDWEWVDDYELIDPETGLAHLPFVSAENIAYYDAVIAVLPAAITANEEELTLGDWLCEDYPMESGAYEGEYIFETTLPEGYVLADGTNVLRLTVVLGDPEGEQAGQLMISPTEPPTGTHTINGTSYSDVYELSTPAHLYWFAQEVNGGKNTINAVLTENITVNSDVLNEDGTLKTGSFEVWTPIGTVDKAYLGKFDGQDHRISGLYVNDPNASYIGLFGNLDNPSFVTRVTVADSYFSGSHNIGGICGSNREYPISYCINYATVCGSGVNNRGTANVGGICGENGQLSHCENRGLVTGSGKRIGGISGTGAEVRDCINYGAVQEGSDYVGGIVGYSTKSISDSENRGAVNGQGEHVGGICGLSTGSSVSVTNCKNYGAVNGEGEYVGGICGDNQYGSVDRCTNSAAVTGSSNNIGGIAGGNTYSGKVTNCRNEGDVIGSGEVGGIVGHNDQNAQVSGCTNTGSVTGSSTFIGGIVGRLATGTVTGCENRGSIKGTSSVGGIVGQINDSGTIETCKNSGTVTGCNSNGETTSNNNDVGGICGDNMGGEVRNCENNGGAVKGYSDVGGICGRSYKNCTISDCKNSGGVTGDTSVGGICGTYQYYNSKSTINVTNCENSGKVTGRIQVGGVCGLLSQGTITRCVNTGEITSYESTIGGICGSTSANRFTVTISQSYNTGSVVGYSGYNTGGICGYFCGTGSIARCYNSASVSGRLNVAGICGKSGGSADKITNCYYLEGNSAIGEGAADSSVVAKTAEQFASGEVAYLLNGSTSTGTLVWYQNIDTGTRDVSPKFTGGTVYKVAEGSPCPGYTNNITYTTTQRNHNIVSHTCTVCGYRDQYPITVSGITAKNKTYDGDTTAELDTLSMVLTGKQDAYPNVSVSATGTFDNANVGTGKTVTITLDLTGDNAEKYYLAESGQQTEATASITAKDITVTFTPDNITYGDGTTVSPKFSGVVGNDDLKETLTYSGTANDGTSYSGTTAPTKAGTYTVTATISNSNYKLTGTTSATFEIGKATVETPTLQSVTYDGETHSPVIAADALYKLPDDFTGKKDADTYPLTLALKDTNNCKWDDKNGATSFTIEKKSLTVTAENKTVTYGDPAPTYTASYEGFVTGETATSLGLAPTFTCFYNSGDSVMESGYEISVSGLNLKNYKISYTPGTLTVNPKTLADDAITLTVADENLVYTGSALTPDVSVVWGDKRPTKDTDYTVGYSNNMNAGSTPQVTVTGIGNYTGTKSKSFTIQPRDISDVAIAVTGDGSLKYTGSEIKPAVTVTNGSYTITATDYEVSYENNVAAGQNTAKVELTGKNNYTGTASQTFSIEKADSTVSTAPAAVSGLAYTGQAQTLVTAGSTSHGTMVYSLEENGTYTSNLPTGTNAGSYTVWYKVQGNDNHLDSAPVSVTCSIAQKGLTVKANNKTITYGDAPANDGVTYEGFVNEETVAVLGGTLAYDYSYSQFDNVGTGEFKITPSGLTSGNYDITFEKGTLTVQQKEIGIDWSNTSLAYNKAEQAPTATANGLVNNDRCTITVTGQQTNVGNYTATASSLSNDNYKLPQSVTTPFSIEKKEVTITGTTVAATKVYDGNTTAQITSDGELQGKCDGDDLTIVRGTAAYDNKNVGESKITFSGFSLGGSAKDNYTLTDQPTSVTADITAKPVTLVIAVEENLFDGTNGVIYSASLEDGKGFVDNDDVAIEGGDATFAHCYPAENIPVTFTAFSLTGADAGNYSITNPTPENVTGSIKVSNRYLNLENNDDFAGQTEVWVDGVACPVQTDAGTYAALPESGDLLTIYTYKQGTSTAAHENYPTGMVVYSIVRDAGGAKLQKIDELDNLLQYSGCSIRINGKPGIRMITSLTKEAKEALKKGELAGYTLEEYGTVVAWDVGADMQLPLTLGNGNKHNYAYKKGVSDPVFSNVDNLTQYTNVLVWDSLTDAQLAQDILMRPYIKLSNKAGETVVLYGGTVSRSIGYVAQQNANTFSKGTAGYKYVHEIIDKVNALHSSTETNTTGG